MTEEGSSRERTKGGDIGEKWKGYKFILCDYSLSIAWKSRPQWKIYYEKGKYRMYNRKMINKMNDPYYFRDVDAMMEDLRNKLMHKNKSSREDVAEFLEVIKSVLIKNEEVANK